MALIIMRDDTEPRDIKNYVERKFFNLFSSANKKERESLNKLFPRSLNEFTSMTKLVFRC